MEPKSISSRGRASLMSKSPTLVRRISLRDLRSTMEMSFEAPLAVYSLDPVVSSAMRISTQRLLACRTVKPTTSPFSYRTTISSSVISLSVA